MRRWLAIMAALVAVSAATACGSAMKGLTGISVDAEGHPVIVLAWCKDAPPDEVRVSHDEPSPGASQNVNAEIDSPMPAISPSTVSVDDVKFTTPDLDGQAAVVRFDGTTDGWTATPGPLVLKPGIIYTAIGFGGTNGGYHLGDVQFGQAEVAKLKPGQVLVRGGEEGLIESTGPDGKTMKTTLSYEVISPEEFDRRGQNTGMC